MKTVFSIEIKKSPGLKPRVRKARFHLDVSLDDAVTGVSRAGLLARRLGSGGLDPSAAGQLAADGRPLCARDRSASPSSLLSAAIISPGICAVNRYFLPPAAQIVRIILSRLLPHFPKYGLRAFHGKQSGTCKNSTKKKAPEAAAGGLRAAALRQYRTIRRERILRKFEF